ncbi:MAG: hypothetical protein U0R17_03470 [Acidimicrobiia bacterium]
MAIDSSFLITGRHIRGIWRDEEEDYIAESFAYTQKNLSILDYLASAAHSGNQIKITTPNFDVSGILIHIGQDFFSISDKAHPRMVHSFPINSSNNVSSSTFEIEVIDKSMKSISTHLLRNEKSFNSLLDDIYASNQHCEIETFQGNIFNGPFSILKDCICIGSSTNNKALVNEGSIILPINGIASIAYRI